MKVIQGYDLTDAFYNCAECLMEEAPEVEVKGKITKEFAPVTVKIDNPCSRVLLSIKRGNNPFAALYETMWILAGSNFIKELSFFMPRAVDFCDNPESQNRIWRAGYNWRLRNATGLDSNACNYYLEQCSKSGHSVSSNGHVRFQSMYKVQEVDQLRYVYETLKKDPSSRQAVMTLWDPVKEYHAGSSKDYPCSNWVTFRIRDNKLHCMLGIRSNDLLWGFSHINVYEFTVIQEILAGMLGVEVGEYHHVAQSLHIYQHHWEKTLSIIDFRSQSYGATKGLLPNFNFSSHSGYEDTMEYYGILLQKINKLVNCNREEFDKIVIRHIRKSNDLDSQIYFYLLLGAAFKRMGNKKNFRRLYNDVMPILPFTDLKCSVNFWIMKACKEIKIVELSKAIEMAHTDTYF